MFIFWRTAKCYFLISYPLKKWLPILKKNGGGGESRVEKSLKEKEKGIKSYLIYCFKLFYAEQNTAGPYWYLNDYQIILILFPENIFQLQICDSKWGLILSQIMKA